MNHRQSSRRLRQRKCAGLDQDNQVNEPAFVWLKAPAILSCLTSGNLSTVEQIAQLVDADPHHKRPGRGVLKKLKRILGCAQTSQQSAFQATEQLLGAAFHSNGALAEAARHAESDEARMDIADIALDAGRLGLEGTRTIERMNQDNNNLWRWMTGAAVAAGIAAVAGMAILCLAIRRENSE